jgi:acyl carrier protein
VSDPAATAATVRKILVSAWPQRFDPAHLDDEVSLGKEGLGLDSVEVVELLLLCEQESGLPLGEELFAVTPLTIRRVADHFAAE